jgi:hypothetical protein
MEDAGDAGAPVKGAGAIMVSYRELVEIRSKMERLDAKLDAALVLRAAVEKLEKRVTSLETDRAVRSERSGLFGKAASVAWALALLIIGAGLNAWSDKFTRLIQ